MRYIGACCFHSWVGKAAIPAVDRTIRVDSMSMAPDTKIRPIRILITGFGAFGSVVRNPSERLARKLGRMEISGAQVDTHMFRVSYKRVSTCAPEISIRPSFRAR